MTVSRSAVVGRWRVVEADLRNRGFLDLRGPATMVVGVDGHGEISFGAVQVELDIAYGFRDIDSPGAASMRWTKSEARLRRSPGRRLP